MSRTARRARARLVPVGATHLRQPGFLAAAVLADEDDVFGVDVHVAALELDDESVARDAEHLARLHAEVAADAVHAVHDEVAGREAFVVIGAAPAPRCAVHTPAAGEVGLGDEREARSEGPRRDRAVRPRRRRRPDLRQDLFDARLRPPAFGRDEHAKSVAPQRVDACAERVDVADDRIERRRRARACRGGRERGGRVRCRPWCARAAVRTTTTGGACASRLRPR